MNRFEKVPIGANKARQLASHCGKAFWFVVRMAEVPCSRTPSSIRLSMALRGIR